MSSPFAGGDGERHATVLFTYELFRRAGGSVDVVCRHPERSPPVLANELPRCSVPSRSCERFMTLSDEAAESVAWLATTENPDGSGARRPPLGCEHPSRGALTRRNRDEGFQHFPAGFPWRGGGERP